ncbi:MAG: calcium/sodium antiporter [Alkalispirochaeta sp.]
MSDVSLLLNTAFLVIGGVLLYFGGNGLVRGAGGLALHFDISPLLVGLTVVAFGTSAPELFVSTISAVQGKMGISVGNVLGSNVINIALILGIASVVRPASVDRGVIRFDAPFMFGTYILVTLAVIRYSEQPFWSGGILSRWEGALLIAVLVTYLVILYHRSGETSVPIEEIPLREDAERPVHLDLILVVVGVGALAGGAELLVRGASVLATDLFGASERFVGITIVALGTSLPELVTTLVSLRNGETDISVGNIVGSNIFNSLMVLGATASIRPIEIGATDYRGDFAFMVGTTLLLLLFLKVAGRVPRIGGGIFLVIYGGYVVYLAVTRTA